MKCACSQTILLSLVISLISCKHGIFAPPSPRLDELEAGTIHVTKLQSTDEEDIYKATYVVFEPLTCSWKSATKATEWLEHSGLVEEVRLLSNAAAKQTYRVKNTYGKDQTIVVRQEASRRMIFIDFVDNEANQLGSCTVRMRSLFQVYTLVDISLHVSRDVATAVAQFLTAPVALLGGDPFRTQWQAIANDLAREHRDQSESACVPPPTRRRRVHILAIGVNSLDHHDVWKKYSLEELSWAEDDARAFAEAVRRVFPDDDGKALTKVLTDRQATSSNVYAALEELAETGNTAPVQNGDSIFFFFAGHVNVGKDEWGPANPRGTKLFPHFLTVDAFPGAGLPRSTVILDAVIDALEMSQATSCVLVCDTSIHRGRRVRQAAVPVGRPPRYEIGLLSKTAVFAAADKHDFATERADLQQGLFTDCIVRAIQHRNADTDRDGRISLVELSAYVKAEMQAMANDQNPLIMLGESAAGGMFFPLP